MDTFNDDDSIGDISESEYELSVADQTNASPRRGRSVKEYDEELQALTKENFHLKLRIYNLQEIMSTNGFKIEDKDNVIRKNIEYKVELESLRKDLEEKQELLCQALKAIELEETEHKKLVVRKDQQIADLNAQLEAVQQDTTALSEMNELLVQKQNKMMEVSTDMYTEAFNLQSSNSNTKLEIEQFQTQIKDLETQLAEEREHNNILEANLQELETLNTKVHNLELELKERDCKITKLTTDVGLKSHTISSLNLKVRTLEDDLKTKIDDIEVKETEIYQQQELIKENLFEIDEYKKKLIDGHIINDKEQRQIENLKSSIVSRDNAIADLENKLERCKTVIRNLEAKLEKIALENKRHQEELIHMKGQRRSASVNESRIWSPLKSEHRCHSSNDYSCDKAETDDVRSLKEALKKKDEQYKNACSMVQSFILSRKSLERENSELQTNMEKKDMKIVELQKELKRLAHNAKNFEAVRNPTNHQEYEFWFPMRNFDKTKWCSICKTYVNE